MEPKPKNTTEGETKPLSKKQQKRLAKKKLKDEEKRKKREAREALEANKPKAQKKKEEISDPQEYYKNRAAIISKLKEDKEYFPYPHKWQISHTLNKAVAEFDAFCTENGKFIDEKVVSLAGRVDIIREQSRKLYFIDITGEEAKIQIMLNMKLYGNDKDFVRVVDIIKRGDIIGVSGPVGRTKKGELTVLAKKIKLLSPCLRMLPQSRIGLKDLETRYRQRYLDLIVNKKTIEIFKTRSRIITRLRHLLIEREFMEVETPTLNIIPGGANARPFKTFHNELRTKMFMRIAPELYLKKCIVGGIDRVFEIGKNFRNEGIDHTHNPEFTSCELYWAYADYKDLMEMTEELICSIVQFIKGTLIFEVTDQEGKKKTIDFTRPWKRISMMEDLSIKLGKDLPTDLSTPEANAFFDKVCVYENVRVKAPRTTNRLINKLVEHLIEDRIIHPTFLMEQPQLMCPLAKYHRDKPNLTERFELFIDGKEFINAYTELNDPFVQMKLFEEQLVNKKKGDKEANDIDFDFVTALEHALPPTAGWGLGIDRLCMLLTDSYNIQEVILFPAMKPKVKVLTAEQEVDEESDDGMVLEEKPVEQPKQVEQPKEEVPKN